MTYRTEVITSNAEFHNLQGEWNELLSSSPSDNYFLRWEWLWTWWHVFAKNDDRLFIIRILKNNTVVAIAPFYVRKMSRGIFPIRRMMFLGTQESSEGDVCSEYMNVICENGIEKEIAGIIIQVIQRDGLCHEAYFSRMDSSSNVLLYLRIAAAEAGYLIQIANKVPSPYIDLPPTWEDYLSQLSRSMRSKIKREQKKMQSHTDAGFIKVETRDELKRSLDELMKLHQNTWIARGFYGSFSNDRFTRFHETITPYMVDHGNLELILLSVENITRGAIYNIVYKNKTYFYQSGIDRRKSGIAFGYILHSHCIEEAIKAGRKIYDFLPKGRTDGYKDRFANNVRMVCELHVILNKNVKCLFWGEHFARHVYQKVQLYYARKQHSGKKNQHVLPRQKSILQ